MTERARVHGINGFDPPDDSELSDHAQHDDLRAAIDEEIARLPDRYRKAVVLCYLEGLTQEQAAHRLRCPLGPSRAACTAPANACVHVFPGADWGPTPGLRRR